MRPNDDSPRNVPTPQSDRSGWLLPAEYPDTPDALPPTPPPVLSTALDMPLADPILTGTGIPGHQVLVLIDHSIRRRVEVDADGCFSVVLPENLPAGEHTLRLYQANAAGGSPTVLTVHFFTEGPLFLPPVAFHPVDIAEQEVRETALALPDTSDHAALEFQVGDTDDVMAEEPAFEFQVSDADDVMAEEPAFEYQVGDADDVMAEEPAFEYQVGDADDVMAEEPAFEYQVGDADDVMAKEPAFEFQVGDADDVMAEDPIFECQVGDADASTPANTAPLLPREPALLEQVRLFDFPSREESPYRAPAPTAPVQHAPPVPATDVAAPSLFLEGATTGPRFRSITLAVSAAFSAAHMLVHTVFLPTGSPPPAIDALLALSDALLSVPGAARCVFPIAQDEQRRTVSRAMQGREGIRPLPQETGLIDGLRYDVFMVGVTPDRQHTEIVVLRGGVLAMPFSGGNGTEQAPYLLRQLTAAELAAYPDLSPNHPMNRAGVSECARMLDNIEGLRALYESSDGRHGLADALSRCYRLTTNMDLSGYESAHGGRGWRPIGDPCTGAGHAFSGMLSSAHASVAIIGMTQRSLPNRPAAALGFVGALSGGTLRTLWLDHPSIAAQTEPGRQGYIGCFVGQGQGVLEGLRVTHGQLRGGCADDTGRAWVGGIIGAALDDSVLARLEISDTTLIADSTPAALGGIAGLFSCDYPGQGLLADSLVRDTQLSGSGLAGGAVGTLACTLGTLTLRDLSIAADIHGGEQLGMLAGRSICSSGASIYMDRCKTSGTLVGDHIIGGLVGDAERLTCHACESSTAVDGHRLVGGLIGVASRARLTDCKALATVVASDTDAGGLVAKGHALVCRRCAVRGNVHAAKGHAGGLLAVLSGKTLSPSLLEDCLFDGRATCTGLCGGIVRETQGTVRIVRCLSAGLIIGFSGAAGILFSGDGGASVSASAALCAEVSAQQADARIARIAAHSAPSLHHNVAREDMALLASEKPRMPLSAPDASDGQSFALPTLADALAHAGWSAAWDLAPLLDHALPMLRDMPTT